MWRYLHHHPNVFLCHPISYTNHADPLCSAPCPPTTTRTPIGHFLSPPVFFLCHPISSSMHANPRLAFPRPFHPVLCWFTPSVLLVPPQFLQHLSEPRVAFPGSTPVFFLFRPISSSNHANPRVELPGSPQCSSCSAPFPPVITRTPVWHSLAPPIQCSACAAPFPPVITRTSGWHSLAPPLFFLFRPISSSNHANARLAFLGSPPSSVLRVTLHFLQ